MSSATSDFEATATEHRVDDYGVAKLHNIFIRFLLPLPIEVQHMEILEQP